MKEPWIKDVGAVEEIPYSRVPVSWLREVINNEIDHQISETGRAPDTDFRRRYAAILLAERGQ